MLLATHEQREGALSPWRGDASPREKHVPSVSFPGGPLHELGGAVGFFQSPGVTPGVPTTVYAATAASMSQSWSGTVAEQLTVQYYNHRVIDYLFQDAKQ